MDKCPNSTLRDCWWPHLRLIFSDWLRHDNLTIHWVVDIEDDERLGGAVVSEGPSVRSVYCVTARHLVSVRCTTLTTAPALQLQNIPAQSQTIIRQVLSGEHFTQALPVTWRLTGTFVLSKLNDMSLLWLCWVLWKFNEKLLPYEIL